MELQNKQKELFRKAKNWVVNLIIVAFLISSCKSQQSISTTNSSDRNCGGFDYRGYNTENDVKGFVRVLGNISICKTGNKVSDGQVKFVNIEGKEIAKTKINKNGSFDIIIENLKGFKYIIINSSKGFLTISDINLGPYHSNYYIDVKLKSIVTAEWESDLPKSEIKKLKQEIKALKKESN